MGGVGSGGHNIKAPELRANRRARKDLPRVVDMRKAPPPELDIPGYVPERTREWWAMWCRSPLTRDFTDEDWSELLDTAILHAFVWSEENIGSPSWFKATAQLRQRTANYGATPLDRQRLRIQFSFADEAEAKAEERGAARTSRARDRRGPHTGRAAS